MRKHLFKCHLFVLFILLCVYGCSSIKCLPEVEYKDSIRIEYKLDSIRFYERDSIYIDRSKDTIYKEVWRWRNKDKIILQHDTILKNNVVVLTKEVKYIPTFYKWCTGLFIGLSICLILYIGIKLYLKFKI